MGTAKRSGDAAVTTRIQAGVNGCAAAALVFVALAAVAWAQTSPASRTLPVSKAQLEKALRSLPAFPSGKLPILDGFVRENTEQPLDRYKRAYYQYSLQTKATGTNQVEVRVTAKITAWYTSDDPARSGYRVLTSNGRLESDLLDRLGEALNLKSASAQAPSETSSEHRLPDAPAPALNSSTLFGTKPGVVAARKTAKPMTAQDEHRIEQLRQQKKNLEEILQQQTRPNNLAVVRASQTAILQQPMDSSGLVMLADAEDEFQVLGRAGEWVHVQVSGLSRGWVKASLVDLPATFASAAPSSNLSVDIDDATFTRTKEETSTFPGTWDELRGKKVKIIWVQAGEAHDPDAQSRRLTVAKSVFRKAYPELSQNTSGLAGVVVVFDAQDGGMAAATMATLEQWNAGHLTDKAFWKRCWFDPADAFGIKE
jgi:hypothetical protein